MTCVGVFGARHDHRGLATLTALMVRRINPAKVVVVDMGANSPTAFQTGDVAPIDEVVPYGDLLTGAYDLAPFLDGLDTVLTFELPYHPDLYAQARRRGVRTVQVTMPELDAHYPKTGAFLPRPDVIALPTAWMAERYPGCPILPVPSDPWTPVPGDLVVHPAALAMADRNGTRTVIDASRFTDHHVVVRGQSPPDQPWRRATVEVADLPDSRDLYAGAAVVVIPRRYGGLSLTMQEAMSAGLPLMVGEHDPYAHHLPPEARIRSVRGRVLQAKGGAVQTWDCAVDDAVAKIGAVMADNGLRAELAAASRKWEHLNSWPMVEPLWSAVLGATVAA